MEEKKKIFPKRTRLLMAVTICLVLITTFSLAIFYKQDHSKILNTFIKTNDLESFTEAEEEKEEDIVLTEEILEEIEEENTETPVSAIPSQEDTDTISTDWWTYPNNILTTTREGNDLLVLVNKQYKLPSTYVPSDLVSASQSGIRRGSSYLLRSILINDLKDLVNAIASEGIDLSIVSAYRSYSTQESTYLYWVNYNGGSTDEADKISARAGHSQHQLGTAIDFSTNEISDGIGSQFNGTKAQIWLSQNAYKYGFVLSFPYGAESITGFSYESWHYRYLGKTYAEEMHNSGMILENYLKSKN